MHVKRTVSLDQRQEWKGENRDLKHRESRFAHKAKQTFKKYKHFQCLFVFEYSYELLEQETLKNYVQYKGFI